MAQKLRNMKNIEDMSMAEKQEYMQQVIDELAERGELDVVRLNIEEHQGWLYAWDADNNEFLGQGETRDQLFQRLSDQVTRNTMFKIANTETED